MNFEITIKNMPALSPQRNKKNISEKIKGENE